MAERLRAAMVFWGTLGAVDVAYRPSRTFGWLPSLPNFPARQDLIGPTDKTRPNPTLHERLPLPSILPAVLYIYAYNADGF